MPQRQQVSSRLKEAPITKRPRASAAQPVEIAAVPQALLRLPVVLATAGISRTTYWRLRREGKFPEPIKLSVRAVRWRAADVHAWIEGRVTASRAA